MPSLGKYKPIYVERKVNLYTVPKLLEWMQKNNYVAPYGLHTTIAYSRNPVNVEKANWIKDTNPYYLYSKVWLDQFKNSVVVRFECAKFDEEWQQYKDIGASWDWGPHDCHFTIFQTPEKLDLSSIDFPFDHMYIGFHGQEIEDLITE